jgi:hypothetical protein
MNAQDAISLARQIAVEYVDLDVRLASEVPEDADGDQAEDRMIERALVVLDAISGGRRALMPLVRLMKHPNPRIRSKAALFMTARVCNVEWARNNLNQVDDRVRANIVEGLWGCDSPEARQMFWSLVTDRNNRVRGNALLALYELDEIRVLAHIRDLAASEDPAFRATAAWLIGSTKDTRFLPVLGGLLCDADPKVRQAGARALSRVKREQMAAPPPLAATVVFQDDVDGHRRLGVQAVDRTGTFAAGLRETDFIVSDGGGLVWDYSVREQRGEVSNAVFALVGPAVPTLDQRVRDALLECLMSKRAEECWLCVKLVDPGAGALAFSWQAQVETAQTTADPESLPPPCTGAALREAIEQFEDAPVIHPENLAGLVRLLGMLKADRRLVLLIAAFDPPPAEVSLLIRLARHLDVTIDAVMLKGPQSDTVKMITRDTGGVLLPAPDENAGAGWLAVLYKTQANRYEITYPTQAGRSAGPIEVRIQPKAGCA